jgi:N-acetyl-gamma-glutamylphosphate reductase
MDASNYKVIKPVVHSHKTNVVDSVSKYRSLYHKHEIEIRSVDSSSGFMTAMFPFTRMGIIGALYVVSTSCYKDEKYTTCRTNVKLCSNTVPVSGCHKAYEIQINEDLPLFLQELKGIKK